MSPLQIQKRHARAFNLIELLVVNVNLAFADGHVETRARAKIEWQQSGNWTTFH